MAPDLNSLATAASSSVTSSGHQQAQNNHHLSTSLQPQPTTSSSRNSTSRSASNRSSPNHSRRTSQLSPMNPPPLPLGHHSNASSTAHTHQQSQQTYAPFPPLSPNMSSMSGAALNGRARTGSGAGAETDAGVPMRHPRPLTAAELHHELELEQEAVVSIGLLSSDIDFHATVSPYFDRLAKSSIFNNVIGKPLDPRTFRAPRPLGLC
ncbi:hypothetical protein JOL62DRAFT_580249, partial [Phyllosticta paracitricarpa]